MTIKKYWIGILSLVLIFGTLDYIFKIDYSENRFYKVSDLRLNDSIIVKSGKILIGKNIQGEIEAIIFPDLFLENGIKKEVEYVYMRFYPKWFSKNLASVISKPLEQIDENLFEKGRDIHDENFRDYMHINNYPIIHKNFIPVAIKLQNSLDKIKLVCGL